MADKSFGVKELNLLNASGTPTVTSPNNLNLNANTVAISTSCTIGNNLTITSTTTSANLNISGIATVVNFNATGISTIAQPADSNPMANWTITNNSASAYRFTGPGQSGNEDNPNIYLVRGHRYIFRHNATSSHPIQIRFANAGSAYTDGITYSEGNNTTTDGNNLIFNVQHDAPAQLFYQCTAHGGMVGNIYIVGGPQVISGVVTATTFSGSGANLTNLPAANITGTLPAISGANLTNLPAQATIANNGDNRVITGGSGVNLNGESNLFFNGSQLGVNVTPDSGVHLHVQHDGEANMILEGNVNGQGGFLMLKNNSDNANTTMSIQNLDAGGQGTSDITFQNVSNANNEGFMMFKTRPSGGSMTERLRIASDGNFQLNNYSGNAGQGRISFGNSGPAFIEGYDSGNAGSGAYLRFQVTNNEKVRIPRDTWGLLVTDQSSTGNTGGYQTSGVSLREGGDSTFVMSGAPAVTMTRKINAGKVLDFYSNTNYAGGVYVNGQNSAQYQSSSDYRLKDNVISMSDGISKVKQLNPIYYTNKQIGDVTDTSTVYNGFLAHEVQSVIPTLVDGEKDADIDERGKGYQTLNYAGFAPTAIAAIKELIAKVETLEAEVAALKGS